MSKIELNHVTKTYPGGVRALDDIELTIKPGEFMVLVGPSGCGKSTLLRLIAGLEEISEGTIRIGGQDVTHLPPPQRDIAMVFQTYALYPHMTVSQNLGYGLSLAHRGRTSCHRPRGCQNAGAPRQAHTPVCRSQALPLLRPGHGTAAVAGTELRATWRSNDHGRSARLNEVRTPIGSGVGRPVNSGGDAQHRAHLTAHLLRREAAGGQLDREGG